MNFISKLLLFLSIMVIVVCIDIGIFPGFFKSISDSLGSASNVFSYLGMLFAAAALFIACFAFDVSIARPDLKLSIWSGSFFENEITLCTNRNTKIVPEDMENISLHFRLNNKGKASARYLLVEILFEREFFTAYEFSGWEGIYHENNHGFYGFRWSSKGDSLIYPGFSINLPSMNLSGKIHCNLFYLNITIVADGFDKKSYTVPVSIH